MKVNDLKAYLDKVPGDSEVRCLSEATNSIMNVQHVYIHRKTGRFYSSDTTDLTHNCEIPKDIDYIEIASWGLGE